MDKHALAGAVNALISHPDANTLLRYVNLVTKLPADVPVCLVGEAAVVDPLLQLARQDYPAFERVLQLADRKRRQADMPPLLRDKFDGTTYQREVMLQQRARERRAVDIENLLRSEKDKLIGRARLDFMRVQASRWKELRDRMLNAERERFGGSLPKDKMREVLADFWQHVDNELDELEELARKELLNPGRRK